MQDYQALWYDNAGQLKAVIHYQALWYDNAGQLKAVINYQALWTCDMTMLLQDG